MPVETPAPFLRHGHHHDALDARLVWSDRAMGVVVVAVPEERRRGFYRHGALLVSGAGMPAACFNWSKG